MSRFYGSIQGDRGAVTRTGHRTISAHPRGWDIGIKVEGYISTELDAFDVILTGGSNGSRRETNLLTVHQYTDGTVQVALGLEGHQHYFDLNRDGEVTEHHPLRQSARTRWDR